MKTRAALRQYLMRCRKAFASAEQETIPDQILSTEFRAYPRNKQHADVLRKAVLLNFLYRTNVAALRQLTKHIVSKGDELDRHLASGDLSAVDLIRKGHGIRRSSGTEINFYSFATKYCHWHRPSRFPVYDRFAAKSLKRACTYLHLDCAPFNDSLKKPLILRNTIKLLRSTIEWPHKGYKAIDEALFMAGKDLAGTLKREQKRVVGKRPQGL